MRDLVAQVTSSLLQFPEVSIQALGEDEIRLDSVLRGKFAQGRNGWAWLACGPQLEVVNSITGERLSAYRFSGITEQPPTVLAVKEFCWLKRTGLLVGLEETEGSVLALYDLGISRVVKAVVLPGRVTAIEPIINHGGASASTQHLHQSLRWFFGVVAAVTDIGHVFLIDLCLDDLSCSQSELEASDLEIVNRIPADIPQIREAVTRDGRHLCYQLQSATGTSATVLHYISRTNQLAVGFSDGYLSLWNLKTLKKEYHSQLEGGRVPIYAIIFQEPENDPRSCCYLWAVQSAQDYEGDVLSLHLLQLAFGDRKCLASGQILYEGLEYCEERYSQDLTRGAFSLRGQSSSIRLLGCQTVEKFRSHADREESMNEVMSPDTSIAVFSWQVNTYGQGKPFTYLGIFDINRWYHAQMPDSLRPGESLHNCPYFALWSLEAVVGMTSPHHFLDILVHEKSLSRGVPPSYPPPEQFFNPSSYNFDATCLLNLGIVHLTCSGFQKETLQFLKKSGACLHEAIPDGYSRCLVAGLLSPRLVDIQPSCLTQEEQLEALLSAAVETSSLGLLTGCIRQWTAEEQPRSAANLRFVLEWAWKKVVCTKEELDRICGPLFDGSCNFIDVQTLQSLQHCQLLLSNLSTVFNCFLTEAQELTEKGLVDLTNKYTVAALISQYAQVVLWFCRSGLLPDGSDDDEVLQLSRPFYNYPLIQSYYTGRRQKLERLSRGKWCADCLMIDGMISQYGDRIEKLWSRDDGGTGRYPPSTLHALLDLYLLENVEETTKHAIVIYLLLDVMYSFPNKSKSSIEAFPTAFAIPLGVVKLIQGFWLLDHSDHENSLDLILHPATSRLMSSWEHTRIIQALMCQGEHKQALRYIQMMKPSMSSTSEVKLYLTVLLFNRCMVEAWNLLRQHANRLNVEDLLKHMYETCQEMGLMEDLLKLPFSVTEQECLERFLQNSGGIQNHEFLLVHHLQRANYVPALQLNQSLKMNLMNDRDPRMRERAAARNSILDQYGKVLPRVQRRLATERAKPYHHPSAVLREVSRPMPLSTVAKPAASGKVLTKATFISNVLSKIGEVWPRNEWHADLSPYNSPKVEEPSPSASAIELPDAFIGTPITKSLRRISCRLLESVVRPVLQSPSVESVQHMPPKASPDWMTFSPVQRSAVKSAHLKRISKASELSLLQTPPVVKMAKALASSTASGFSGFAPQSILRSNLRPSPLASPSASPGRSVTPPLRVKETRISFMEENITARWNSGVAGRETNLSAASGLPSRNSAVSPWDSRLGKGISFDLEKQFETEIDEDTSGGERNGTVETEVSKEVSNVSARSEQSTLEYHDAQAPEDFEEDIIILNSRPVASVDVGLIESVVKLIRHAEQESVESANDEPSKSAEQRSIDGVSYGPIEHVDGLIETVDDEPIKSVEVGPGESVDDRPIGNIDDGLAGINDGATEIVNSGPAEIVDNGPTEIVDNGPTEIIDNGPAEIVGKECAKINNEPASNIVDDEPAEIEDEPAEIVDGEPAKGVEDEPAEGVEDEPAEGVEDEPAEGVDDEPAEGVDETVFTPEQQEKQIMELEDELLLQSSNKETLLEHRELDEAEYDAVPENGISSFVSSYTLQEMVTSTCVTQTTESETSDYEKQRPLFLPNEQDSVIKTTASTSDNESVISVHDSEDVVSTHSENKSESGSAILKDHDSEVEILEENVGYPQDKTVLILPVKTVEVHMVEDGELEEQATEEGAGDVSYAELHPPEPFQVAYTMETELISQQLSSDVVNATEAAECEIAVMDGNQDCTEGNFTLILEGEDEDSEIEIQPELEIPDTFNIEVADENHKDEEQTSMQESSPVVTEVQEQHSIAETLPYVPEPIKVSIAENLLAVIKDTRNKEFTVELVEPLQGDKPMTDTALRRSFRKSLPSPVQDVKEPEIEDLNLSQAELSRTYRRHNRGKIIQKEHDHSIESQQLESEETRENEQEVASPSTSRRNVGKVKETLEVSGTIHPDSDEEQASQTSALRRSTRKKNNNVEISGKKRPVLDKRPQTPATLRRGTRRTKDVNVEVPEIKLPVVEGEPLKKAVHPPATPPRVTRRTTEGASKVLEREQPMPEEAEMSVSPVRSSRKTKGITFSVPENVHPTQEEKLVDHDTHQPLTPRRTARSSVLQRKEASLPVSAKASVDKLEHKLPVTPRITRKGVSNLQEGMENISYIQEDLGPQQGELRISPRRSTRKGVSNLQEGMVNSYIQEDMGPQQEGELRISPSRSTRKGASDLQEGMENISYIQEDMGPQQGELRISPRSTTRKGVSILQEGMENSYSQEDMGPQQEGELRISPRRSTGKGVSNLQEGMESVSYIQEDMGPQQEELHISPRRSTRRVVTNEVKPTGHALSALEKTSIEHPGDMVTLSRSTRRTVQTGKDQAVKKQLPAVTENTSEKISLQPESSDKSILESTITHVTEIPSRKKEPLTVSKTHTTRSRVNKVLSKDMSLHEKESFVFTSPITRVTRKSRAEGTEHPVSPTALESLFSSKFAFSPPATRSKQKPKSVKELALPAVEGNVPKVSEVVEMQEKKSTKSRTVKTRTKKSKTEKGGPWSPPPVEVNLISPMPSPLEEQISKHKGSEEATNKMTLRTNRKRLMSAFPKPVTRRKML